MPSFDIVSEVDLHEFSNAVDQAGRIIQTRFDFKGVDARFDRSELTVVMFGATNQSREKKAESNHLHLDKLNILNGVNW